MLFKIINELLSVCDGALEKDGVGFNSPDSGVARYLARMHAAGLIDSDAELVAWNMLQKYKKQKPEIADIPKPESEKESEEDTVEKAKDRIYAKRGEVRKKETKHAISLVEDSVIIQFAYDENLVAEVRNIPGSRFNGQDKTWSTPIKEKSLLQLKSFISKYANDWEIGEDVYNIIERAHDYAAINKVDYVDQKVVFNFDYDQELIALVKTIPGRRFDSQNKTWYTSLNVDNVNKILEVAEKGNFKVSFAVFKAIEEYSNHLESNLKQSESTDDKLEIKDLGGVLRPFQRAGVKFLSNNKSALLADEQGLGKTVQALAALQHNNAFPALIVAPASVQTNWIKEAKKWIPDRTINYSGTLSNKFRNEVGNVNHSNADITIVSYSKLNKLIESTFKAVVFDESHYLKNYKAKRTQFASIIASHAEYKYLLTGTPIVNRPAELISQLNILGKFNEFGGWYQFTDRYCDRAETKYGTNISGAKNLDELHRKLRTICMIRRDKKEVLPELPDKVRTNINLSITNKREYLLAYKELLEYLKGFDGKKACAEAIVEINKLRSITAKGKLDDGLDWAYDFLESGKKLVIFAHHKEIQNKIYESLISKEIKAVHLNGDDSSSARQAAIDAFQNDNECQVIVCSLKAGGVGVNLQAASDILFFEQGWTPGDMMQAEDRCHRMGQKNSVNIYYLLADDTIDDTISRLIEVKRGIIEKAIDGTADNNSIADDLILKLSQG